MIAELVDERKHLVQRQLLTAALPSAQLAVGRVRDDAVQPGPERRLTAEGVDLQNHGPECVLHDFLGVLTVAGDTSRQAIDGLAVSSDQKLRRRRVTTAERVKKVGIAVGATRGSDVIGFSLEHCLMAHLASSLSSVDIRVATVTSLRGEARRFYPTFVGSGHTLLALGKNPPGRR